MQVLLVSLILMHQTLIQEAFLEIELLVEQLQEQLFRPDQDLQE